MGNLERFELTVAMAYRSRPKFSLTPIGGAAPITLPLARSVEVFGSAIDRRSFADMRLGVDAVQTFAYGDVGFQRSDVLALRGFASRELASGKGEWEAEVSYATTKDTATMTSACQSAALPSVADCFGATNGTIISAGGALYYRLDRDWFLIGQAYVSQTTLTPAGAAASDPAILGLSGYFRIAYRF